MSTDLPTDLVIREQLSGETAAVRLVNIAAFGQDDEADLVDALHSNGRVVLSLVAMHGTKIVGHLLLSEANIVDGAKSVPCLALAPMAVSPELHDKEIGTRLARRSIELARERGHRLMVVFGHPEFYPRFGFEPAGERGIICPYDAPPEAFLVVELQPHALDGVAGRMVYAPEFDGL